MAKMIVPMRRTLDTAKSVGSLVADATRPRRGKVYYFCCGSEAAPADQSILWQLQRITAAGTSTGVTPRPVNPADVATELDAGENHTAEPTYTASTDLITVPVHQRSTFKWEAPPDGELIYPATASNGFGVRTPTISSGTPVVTAAVHVDEQ
jgi:hypothetical protein